MTAWLEQHHINVVGGDCTLILVKDNSSGNEVTVFRGLIDAGAESSGSAYLRSYLVEIGQFAKDRPNKSGVPNECYFDLIVATHLHLDHYLGFLHFYDENGPLTPTHFIDTTGQNHDTGFGPTYPDIGLTAQSTRSRQFATYIADCVKTKNSSRINLTFANLAKTSTADKAYVELADKFPQAKALGLRMKVVCANGVLANLGASGQDRIDLFSMAVNDPSGQLNPLTSTDRSRQLYQSGTNPNDYSIAMVIQFGDYTYFTSGDLSGDTPEAKQKFGTNINYKNLEQFVIKELERADWLRDGVTTRPLGFSAAKMAHHGSDHSTYWVSDTDNYLNKVKPRAMIVPTNLKKKVPGKSYLERAQAYVVAQQALAPAQNKMAGMFMANISMYRSGATDGKFQELDKIYPLSSTVTGTKKAPFAPFNMIKKTIQAGGGFSLTELSNDPTSAVILWAPAGVATKPLPKFGDTHHVFEQFVATNRQKGVDFSAGSLSVFRNNFNIPRLSQFYFNTEYVIDLLKLKETCQLIYLEARDRNHTNGGGADEEYIETYYPILKPFYGQGLIDEIDFADQAAPQLNASLKACYSIKHTAISSEFSYKKLYVRQPGDVIRTAESAIVQVFLKHDWIGISSDRERDIKNSGGVKRERTANLNAASSSMDIKRRRSGGLPNDPQIIISRSVTEEKNG